MDASPGQGAFQTAGGGEASQALVRGYPLVFRQVSDIRVVV